MVTWGPQWGSNFKGLYGNLGDDGDLYHDCRVATQVYIYYRIIEPYLGGGPIWQRSKAKLFTDMLGRCGSWRQGDSLGIPKLRLCIWDKAGSGYSGEIGGICTCLPLESSPPPSASFPPGHQATLYLNLPHKRKKCPESFHIIITSVRFSTAWG